MGWNGCKGLGPAPASLEPLTRSPQPPSPSLATAACPPRPPPTPPSCTRANHPARRPAVPPSSAPHAPPLPLQAAPRPSHPRGLPPVFTVCGAACHATRTAQERGVQMVLPPLSTSPAVSRYGGTQEWTRNKGAGPAQLPPPRLTRLARPAAARPGAPARAPAPPPSAPPGAMGARRRRRQTWSTAGPCKGETGAGRGWVDGERAAAEPGARPAPPLSRNPPTTLRPSSPSAAHLGSASAATRAATAAARASRRRAASFSASHHPSPLIQRPNRCAGSRARHAAASAAGR